MTCSNKYKQNCPTGGSKVTAEEGDCVPRCIHAGCEAPLKKDNTCTKGHSQCHGESAREMLAEVEQLFQEQVSVTDPEALETILARAFKLAERSLQYATGIEDAELAVRAQAALRQQEERATDTYAQLAGLYYKNGETAFTQGVRGPSLFAFFEAAARHAAAAGHAAMEAKARSALSRFMRWGADAAKNTDQAAYERLLTASARHMLGASAAHQRGEDWTNALTTVRKAQHYFAAAQSWDGYDQARAEELSILRRAGMYRELAEQLQRDAYMAESQKPADAPAIWQELAEVWAAQAQVFREQGEVEEAVECLRTRLSVVDKLDNPSEMVRALGDLANASILIADAPLARDAITEALTRIGELEEQPLLRAKTLSFAGGIAYLDGNLEQARAYFEESAALAGNGDAAARSQALASLGGVYLEQGETAAAESALRESCELAATLAGDQVALLTRGLAATRLLYLLQSRGAISEAAALREQTMQALSAILGAEGAELLLAQSREPPEDAAAIAARMGWERQAQRG